MQWSLSNLRLHHAAALDSGLLDVRVGDGFAGLPHVVRAEGGFDAIHVGAAAPAIPQALVEQLAPGGELIIPVGVGRQVLVRAVKRAGSGGRVDTEELMGVMYVPLTQREKQDPEGWAAEHGSRGGSQPAQQHGRG